MAAKSANVVARVEPEVKKKAEDILSRLGIPASVGINMFYRQVIYCDGLPFQPTLPARHPKALEDMSKEEFDLRMARGLAQAKAGDGAPVEEVMKRLLGELSNG